MDKEKKQKNDVPSGEENFILKKIRYYQGSIKDYETYWNQKIVDGEREESPETKAFAKSNAELNKAFEIVPVEKDDTVICHDVVSGKDKGETPKENADAKPSPSEEGDKKVDGVKSADPDKKEKKEKKEEKHLEEEEETVKDVKKEEKGEDDDDEKKKKKKKEDKED